MSTRARYRPWFRPVRPEGLELQESILWEMDQRQTFARLVYGVDLVAAPHPQSMPDH